MWKEWCHQPIDISCWNYLISKKEYQNKQWSYFKTFLIRCSIFISLLITFRKCLWKYLPHTTFSCLKSWLLSAKIKSWSFPSSRPMWGEDVPFAQREPKDKIWGKGERAKDEMLLFVSLLAYQTSCVLLTKKTVIVLCLSRTLPERPLTPPLHARHPSNTASHLPQLALASPASSPVPTKHGGIHTHADVSIPLLAGSFSLLLLLSEPSTFLLNMTIPLFKFRSPQHLQLFLSSLHHNYSFL